VTAGDSASILIIDDDDDIRSALSEVLSEAGYPVVDVPGGRAALEFLHEGNRPFAILLDLMMPEMDGWQFRELIAQAPELNRIPIVVMTALRDQHAETLKVCRVLTKPLQLDTLLEVLEECRQPPTQ
jgi:CheY-like chemotaxis protein